MAQLPTDRTDQNTIAEHVSDHDELHTLHNAVDTIGAANIVVTTDSRLSDTRTPTDGSVTDAKVSASAAIAESKLSLASDAAAATASRRTLGTGAAQACAGNDSRLSDSRTPTSHHTSHSTGGSDPIAAADIGAASIDGAGSNAVAAAHTGDTATASSTNAIAIGHNARAATGTEAISIGGGTTTTAPSATGQAAIAIGAADASGIKLGARASAAKAVAIGGGDTAIEGALASGAEAIAIGAIAEATGDDTVAIGAGAGAWQTEAVALGYNTQANHANAVALGDGSITTATSQVNIGAKRLFVGTPNSAPADANLISSQASLWLDEGASNALAFKAKTSGGTVVSKDLSTTDHTHSGTYVLGSVTLTVASSAPGSPSTNDLWVDTT